MKKIYGLLLAGVACLLIPFVMMATTFTYQARVQDSAGNDINGPVSVGFRIYEGLNDPTVLWGETQNLNAVQGIVSVELGKVNPIPKNLFLNPGLYLGISVEGDPEMSGRKRLAGTWKAMSANHVSGKSVQAGQGAISVNGQDAVESTITFGEPFSSPPIVIIGAPHTYIGDADFISVQVTDVTVTGCTAHFITLDGSTATGTSTFDWIAVGE